ncbi:MAG TPA: hypothetical protein EYP19_09500 [Desulfobacterales bacterium]|nr:hypothetical protein [Desulfobacterales bacterium]
MKRNLKKDIAAFLVATFAMAACELMPAHANEKKPSADFSVSALSAYIWRGQELSRDSIVVQPSTTVSYRGFSANLWGNLDTDPYAAQDDPKWTETDFALSYGKHFGLLGMEAGYIYYALQGVDADSQEVFVTLSLDTLLSPGLTVYRDFDTYEHWYFLLGILHSVEITQSVHLELSGSLSYLKSLDAYAYPEIDSCAPTGDKLENFHDGVISASLPIAVAEYIT